MIRNATYKPIETGSYGNVYKIIPKEGEPFVIKRVYVARETDFIGTIQELDFLARMKHSNIVQYKDIYLKSEKYIPDDKNLKRYGKADRIYMGMELGLRSGGSVAFDKRFGWKNKKRIIMDLLVGIEYMHKQGIIHRDIKICNFIQVSKNNKITSKWCDFGGAYHHTIQHRESNDKKVTYMYRAPEIIFDKAYGTQSDIWSFGCMILYILARDEEILFRKLFSSLPKDEYDISNDIMRKELLKIYPHNITDEDIKFLNITKDVLSKNKPKTYKEHIKFKETEEFNKSKGSYDQILDLINKLLVLDPIKRLSATKALQHPFFDFGRKDIDKRTIQPDMIPLKLKVVDHKKRYMIGEYIMNTCLSFKDYFRPYEMMFHAMRLWDQFIVSNLYPKILTGELLRNMCIYLAFKLLNENVDIPQYKELFKHPGFKGYTKIENAEYKFIKEVLKGRIYEKTPLEWADKHISNDERVNLYKEYIKVKGETDLKTIYLLNDTYT